MGFQRPLIASMADRAKAANAEFGGIAAVNAGLDKLGETAAPAPAEAAPAEADTAAKSAARTKAAEDANKSADDALGSMISGMDKIDKASQEAKAATTKAA